MISIDFQWFPRNRIEGDMISLQLLLTKYTSRDQRPIEERTKDWWKEETLPATARPRGQQQVGLHYINLSVCCKASSKQHRQVAPGSSYKYCTSKWLNISSDESQELPFAHALIAVLKVTTSGCKFQNLVYSLWLVVTLWLMLTGQNMLRIQWISEFVARHGEKGSANFESKLSKAKERPWKTAWKIQRASFHLQLLSSACRAAFKPQNAPFCSHKLDLVAVLSYLMRLVMYLEWNDAHIVAVLVAASKNQILGNAIGHRQKFASIQHHSIVCCKEANNIGWDSPPHRKVQEMQGKLPITSFESGREVKPRIMRRNQPSPWQSLAGLRLGPVFWNCLFANQTRWWILR